MKNRATLPPAYLFVFWVLRKCGLSNNLIYYILGKPSLFIKVEHNGFKTIESYYTTWFQEQGKIYRTPHYYTYYPDVKKYGICLDVENDIEGTLKRHFKRDLLGNLIKSS